MPRLRPLAAILALTLALAACGGAPSAGPAATAPAGTAGEPAAEPTAPASVGSGGTLRVGRTAGPDSLNPGVAYLSEAFEIMDLVYDSLIYNDLLSRPQPMLAREFSVAEDNRTWTFKLHEGVTWHDGQPLTSEDVKFTYEMIAGFESFALLKEYTSLLESVEAPDPTTVIITFEEPVANTAERFAAVYILPKHIWSQFADEQAATEFENLEPIGSGPFRLAEYKQGEFARLTANKDHYLSPPKIDEVIFQVFGNDDARVQALRTGEVDLIDISNNTVVRTLQSEPNIKVEIGNSRVLLDIIFNLTSEENCPPDGVCSGHPALKDVQVRQALAHATDKQQIIDVILLGLGTPGLGLVTPAQGEGYASQLEDYAYDPERARQILEEAGYVDTDNDGVREMPGDPSRPLTFRYSYPSDQYAANGQRIFELMNDMWSQVGVKLELTAMEADALTAICCPAFDFDVIQWGWEAGVDPASLLYITTIDQIPTGVSETGYANPEYDALFQEQLTTVDQARRVEILHQMQEVLLRDVPYIIPYYRQNVQAYRSDRFAGWVIEPDGLLSLAGRLSLTSVGPVQ